MTELETDALFTQYLNVVNRAIGAHRDETPYDRLFALSEKAIGDRRIGVAIYRDAPDTPHDWFTIELEKGTFRIVEHGKRDPDATWKVAESHLETVVEAPEDFIEHPWKLDLDWLKTRFGLTGR